MDWKSRGNAFRNNDINVAKIYNKQNNTLIKEYNISGALEPFAKFGNSFIVERYGQPLRAYGAKSYRIELQNHSSNWFASVYRLSII
ncbi:unnamed protein product [Oppiella nova]|uniref:Uncharacterized protein n=1 Tax=Oppiella nova TaxID=334625 RepID=A0A7R9QVP9_9ACAR|nr:unnamed protein product [Oppiella nova]CAG2176103.1 unnamed protein product [Oppiella nova]